MDHFAYILLKFGRHLVQSIQMLVPSKLHSCNFDAYTYLYRGMKLIEFIKWQLPKDQLIKDEEEKKIHTKRKSQSSFTHCIWNRWRIFLNNQLPWNTNFPYQAIKNKLILLFSGYMANPPLNPLTQQPDIGRPHFFKLKKKSSMATIACNLSSNNYQMVITRQEKLP